MSLPRKRSALASLSPYDVRLIDESEIAGPLQVIAQREDVNLAGLAQMGDVIKEKTALADGLDPNDRGKLFIVASEAENGHAVGSKLEETVRIFGSIGRPISDELLR